MKTTIIHCDICGREIIQGRGWEYEPTKLVVHTICTSKNPMSRITGKDFQDNNFTADDVCQPCQRTIAGAVATTIESLKKQ